MTEIVKNERRQHKLEAARKARAEEERERRKIEWDAIQRDHDDEGFSPEEHRRFRAEMGLDHPELDQSLAAFGDEYGKKIVMLRAQAIYNASPEGIAEAQALKAAERWAEEEEAKRLSDIQRNARIERAKHLLSGQRPAATFPRLERNLAEGAI